MTHEKAISTSQKAVDFSHFRTIRYFSDSDARFSLTSYVSQDLTLYTLYIFDFLEFSHFSTFWLFGSYHNFRLFRVPGFSLGSFSIYFFGGALFDFLHILTFGFRYQELSCPFQVFNLLSRLQSNMLFLFGKCTMLQFASRV